VLPYDFGLADAAALATLEVRKDEWIGVYQEHCYPPYGELLYASQSPKALYRELKQRRGVVGPVSVRLARTKEELSAPLGHHSEERPNDWHEELRQAGKMNDDIGFLNFFYAWEAVRQLAQTNDAIDQEKRIESLWRMHREAAEKLGLPKPIAIPPVTEAVVIDDKCESLQESGMKAPMPTNAEPSKPKARETSESTRESGTLMTPQQPPERVLKSWQEIEITFLSDHRVEICCGGANRKTYNYGDLGFQDRRSGKSREPKPARAWGMLCEIAKNNGTIPRPSPGKDRVMIQKRMEEIRKKLRHHFSPEDDPIPFKGNTYQASFRIRCGPSFNT
jgi:hypothetical protein